MILVHGSDKFKIWGHVMDYNKANQKEESDEDNKSKDQARIDLINRGRSYVYVDNALQDCSASKYIKINKE